MVPCDILTDSLVVHDFVDHSFVSDEICDSICSSFVRDTHDSVFSRDFLLTDFSVDRKLILDPISLHDVVYRSGKYNFQEGCS